MNVIRNILGDRKSKNKKSIMSTQEENYMDCPFCGQLISDNGPSANVGTFYRGDKVKCPNCGKIVTAG